MIQKRLSREPKRYVIIREKEGITLYLECYGSSKEENEWTDHKPHAFVMSMDSIERRLPVVQLHFPSAKYKFA